MIDDDEPVDFSEFNAGVDVGHEMMDRNDDELDPDEFENIPSMFFVFYREIFF